ncbi:UDP-glucosyltransferase 29-like [Benincasa hispida]|uniref:UDP-glucosyltransferase 29-like n=1 Tax=Benincasa hispida TaxID=102211 RepID=UPI00190011B3|nr:UDP-glucosyltransferase 29-like [Benincasa hispida]
MEGGYENEKIRILMLPWLAHGHVSPFLELSKLLATRNFHILFCSTSVILHSIQSKLPQNLSSNIELVELTLPTSADLPPHRHTTTGLPSHLMFSLKRAFDSAASAFDAIVRNVRPDLLIYDFLQPWAPAVALSADIPAVMFQCTGALMAAMVTYGLKFGNSDILSKFPEIRVSELEIKQLNNLFRCSVNDAKDKQRIEECNERSCGILFLKSFREIEAKYIDSLSTFLQKKVIPVGPLVEEPENDVVLGGSFEKWLNQKERKSCILVSFGSEFYLSKFDMEEIAYGLELSRLNFIWVVRFPASGGGEGKKNVEEELPKGFLERVGERGMVVEGWVPQAQILKHRSIGGFLSHCGWSSVVESIKFGVPIIAAPMQLDQPLNARLVEHLGVGVVVERSDGGRLCRREVARAVRAVREVVAEESGKRVREKAKEFAKIMKEKGDEEMEVVVEEIMKLCRRKKKGLQSNWCRTSMDSHCCEVMKIDHCNGATPNEEPLCKQEK